MPGYGCGCGCYQHADGRVERLYWPTSAGEVMQCNPGYYVALITFCFSGDVRDTAKAGFIHWRRRRRWAWGSLRLTRARLLKHKDILLIGQVYRLVTSQRLLKGFQFNLLIFVPLLEDIDLDCCWPFRGDKSVAGEEA
ncbi:hypothetical protein HPP92_017287 [Vanilla planifolia]|uniref:Uncharacterized protein n=1 Tax=Vanilla planifolia TaxID=51239 RepID=A0A835UQT3_VANPL|nr:hypothetical protein HPP92_017287 [Vanilla planifolia]